MNRVELFFELLNKRAYRASKPFKKAGANYLAECKKHSVFNDALVVKTTDGDTLVDLNNSVPFAYYYASGYWGMLEFLYETDIGVVAVRVTTKNKCINMNDSIVICLYTYDGAGCIATQSINGFNVDDIRSLLQNFKMRIDSHHDNLLTAFNSSLNRLFSKNAV